MPNIITKGAGSAGGFGNFGLSKKIYAIAAKQTPGTNTQSIDIYKSLDFLTWTGPTTVNIGATNPAIGANNIIYYNGYYIILCVPQNGPLYIVYSKDLINWSSSNFSTYVNRTYGGIYGMPNSLAGFNGSIFGLQQYSNYIYGDYATLPNLTGSWTSIGNGSLFNKSLGNTPIIVGSNGMIGGSNYDTISGTGYPLYYYSADGLSWSSGNIATVAETTSIVYSGYINGNYVVIYYDSSTSTCNVYRSTTGYSSWSKTTASFHYTGTGFGLINSIYKVLGTPSGKLLLSGYYSGSNYGTIFYSTDNGANWYTGTGLPVTASNFPTLYSWKGTFYARMTNGNVYSSSDGQNWSSVTVSGFPSSASFSSNSYGY